MLALEKTKEQIQIVQDVEFGITSDFNKFNHFELNRDVDRKQVEKIKKKIILNQGYAHSLPIIANSNGDIVDGQHRYLACKELGAQFSYIIEKNLRKNFIIDINTTQKNWGIHDYVSYYAKKDRLTYVNLLNFSKTYNVSIGVALTIVLNKSWGGNVTDKVKAGELAITTLQFNHAHKRAKSIFDTIDALKLPATDRLVKALITLTTDYETFNLKELVKKASYQQEKIGRCSTTDGYIDMIKGIYNCRNSKKL